MVHQKEFWQQGWDIPVLYPMGAQDTTFEEAEALLDDDNYIAEIKEDGNHYMFAGGRCFGRKPCADKKKPDLIGYPVEKTENVPHLAEFFADYPKLIVVGEIYYPGYKSNTVTKIMGCSPEKALMRQGFGSIDYSEEAGMGIWTPGSAFPDINQAQQLIKVDKDTLEFLRFKLGEIKFMMFDILYSIDGSAVHQLPYVKRRAILAQFYYDHVKPRYFDDIIHLSTVASGAEKRKLLQFVEEQDGEGIVLKNKNAPYVVDTVISESPGKKPVNHWYKRKTETTDDVVVLGFVEGKDTAKGGKHKGRVGSIRVGQYVETTAAKYYATMDEWDKHDDDVFGKSFKPFEKTQICDLDTDPSGIVTDYYVMQEVGTVGSGYDDDARQHMWDHPDQYIGRVMEVKAMERTAKGKFRHARMIQWREDKAAEQCIYYPTAGGDAE